MNSRSKRVKANVEGDRLSSLPDDLIAKILSFIGAKQAVETSVLSSRWRYVWTKLTHLNLSSEDFSTLRRFCKFFTYLMLFRKRQVETSLNLQGKAGRVFVQRILNDACSHNIQQLSFTAIPEKNIEVPLSLFKSKSLKSLSLIGPSKDYYITPTSTWELPALTRLYLDRVTLYGDKFVDLFSKCKNLKYLTLNNLRVSGGNSFTICHPELSTLVIKNRQWCATVVGVIAPQLKNLSIMNCEGTHMVSAPELTSLQYTSRLFQLSVDVDSLPFIEKLGLCISYPYYAGAQKVVDLLHKFNNVKHLTLSLEIIELLSTSVMVIQQHQPSPPFVNIRSLRIFPELFDEPHKKKINMANEVRNYLLDASPGATFTAVTREKIRAERDAKLAQNLMAELRVVLDKEKASMGNLKEEDKRPQPYTNVPLDVWQRASRIHSFWDGLDEQIKQGKTKTDSLISLMKRIRELLLKLPTSHKVELQPRFSSLCAEAETLIHKILTRMNTECHTKENGLCDSIHEFVIAAQSSR